MPGRPSREDRPGKALVERTRTAASLTISADSEAMDATPKGNRLHVGLFGRTNVGKSTLLNYLVGQEIAITSPVAGTTTDVVEKAAEFPPLGPVLFLDTAGLDDASLLADRRLPKTRRVYERADAIVLVTEPDAWSPFEEDVACECVRRNIPLIIAVNKTDLRPVSEEHRRFLRKKSPRVVPLSALDASGRERAVDAIKRHLLETAPEDFLQPPPLLRDLVPAGGVVVLVVPVDLQAPKGRLILPQVQTIREILDSGAAALTVKDRELSAALAGLKQPPAMAVCDSQAVLKVSADVPAPVPCTTFSILFARQKGDLVATAEGVAAIDGLHAGDRVLIAEACSHHPLQDDIGRVKIPRWLRRYTGVDLSVDVVSGRDFPTDLSGYRLIVHCGACMLNRREMLGRIQRAREAGVALTNYGLAIAFTQGVLRRVLSPFPSALLSFERGMSRNAADDPPGRPSCRTATP